MKKRGKEEKRIFVDSKSKEELTHMKLSEMMEKTELSYRHRSFDGFNLILGLGMPKPVAPLFAKMAPFIFIADIGKKNLLFSDYKIHNELAQLLFGIMLE